MTPGEEAKGRPSGLSRRRLLAGIGGVGAVGMASGLGTGAYLADRETFPDNAFGAGAVGLTVDGDPTDGTVTVGPFAVDRTTFDGRPEPERFEIGASANPVRVWLATRCPDGDPLGDALEVEVVVDGESLTGGYRPLAEVERDLATGRRVDAGCLDPDGGPIVVEVAPYLPADSPDVGGEETDLTVRLYAEQCRHVSEAEANAPRANPFAGVVCEGSEADCPGCVEFGKADFGGSTAPGDVLSLEMILDGAGPHEIEITEVETKDDGEVVGVAFRLRDADGNPGPDMCSVAVKGGPDRNPDPVDIDPASPETGEIVFAPRNPTNGKRYGVSNVTVSVCAGDGAGGGGGDSGGEEEHGDDRTGDGDGGGTGNGGGNGRKGNGTPGKPDGKSANAGVGRGEGGEDGDTEAN
ncbi:hypothetical protein [Halorubrum distributum]|uniref:SipW-cognate class signal peptide n=1 Tax=Halorubrum distributum JCM 13916 TaxID=1230455 RepID=M0PMN1_9EURY|nr:hypothetical protein [Halorubrum arcis]EMA70914.1 hypothetical protein C462_09462 [Halorubrum arcis JCM 13916]